MQQQGWQGSSAATVTHRCLFLGAAVPLEPYVRQAVADEVEGQHGAYARPDPVLTREEAERLQCNAAYRQVKEWRSSHAALKLEAARWGQDCQ
jgi:hypothetical protein